MAEAEPLSIALRGYAELKEGKRAVPIKHARPKFDKPSRWTLVFDTETTTDAAQRLRFGIYQIHERDRCHERGIFFEPAALSVAEIELIQAYAEDRGLRTLTRAEFVADVFYRYAYDYGGTVIGFNLPFDISRVAIDHSSARGFMRGGFSFRLGPEKWRPRVQVKHLNSRTAFIRFAAPPRARDGRSIRKGRPATPTRRGYFVDVRTLAGALMSGSYSLASLAKLLRTPTQKMDTAEHGADLTKAYLDYAVADVQTTWECFASLRETSADHHLTRTQIHRIMSEASLGKAYLREMNIQPLHEVQPDIPREMFGIIMSTYYGGRAEVRIRREPVRVLYCDFRSMYPTVCTLMGLWQFVTAKGFDWREATGEAVSILEETSLADVQNKATWQRLPMLVQISPDADVLPVRARYNGKSRTIGLNHLSADQPLWYTLADCLVSKLLTGKTPTVMRALRFTPRGPQESLSRLAIGGDSAFSIDPTHDDLYKSVIELRGMVQSELADAKRDGDTAREAILDSRQTALKLLANATSYGIFAELNVETEDRPHDVTCYGASGDGFSTRTKSVETPGPFFHPLLASLITGAARLMLAAVERLASDTGLGWAFCDTDSMALARPEGMEDQDFLDRATSVVGWFDELNPYADGKPLFKREAQNYAAAARSDGQHHEPLWCYTISAKRYALFNLDSMGAPVLRKAMAHGLGHYRPPYGSDQAPADIPNPRFPLAEIGVERWQYDLWYRIIEAGLSDNPDRLDWSGLPGLDRPAVSRYAATTPALLKWFASYNESKPDGERLWPFNFLLALQASALSLNQAIAEGQLAPDTQLPSPVAPFDLDHERAIRQSFDRVTGCPVPPQILTTYQDALADYHRSPEAKFANGDAYDRGVTKRRHIQVASVEYIGKEANRWEEQFFLGADPDSQIEYGGGASGLAAVRELLRQTAKMHGLRKLARAVPMSHKDLSAIIAGKVQPRAKMICSLLATVRSLEP